MNLPSQGNYSMHHKLQLIIDDPYSTAHERAMAQAKLRDAGEPPAESDTLQELLRAAGKKHLRDVSDQEFARHSARFGWPERLELDRQRGEWCCPSEEILVLLGLTRLTYWQGVRERAKTDAVRQNAAKEIRKLEGGHA